MIAMRILATACLALLAALRPPAASAQDELSWAGKTVTIIIPIGPGGAYDAYARLVSRHIGKHLPGNPAVVARNMPGAGGVIASNYVYSVAPQDGTTLTIITSSFATEELFGNPQIKYESRKFLALGRLLDTTSVLFFWHASPIRTREDMMAKPSTIAISTVTEIASLRLKAMATRMGAPFKLIPGYPSAQNFVLAVERGETDGGTSTFIGLQQLFSKYIGEKKLNILVQFAMERDPAMPDIPTVLELTKDPDTRQLFQLLVSNDDIGRSIFTTPNVSPARLALLRKAFRDMLADPEFRDDAQRSQLPLAPRTSEEMQKEVADLFDVSPATLAAVRDLGK